MEEGVVYPTRDVFRVSRVWRDYVTVWSTLPSSRRLFRGGLGHPCGIEADTNYWKRRPLFFV